MTELDALGQKIKTLRTKKGLSQQQLADLMFVTRKTISNWESGLRMPDLAMLSRLAKLLGTKSYELIDAISGPDSPPCIIIVEDEPVILKGFVHILSDALPEVQAFGFQTGAEALAYAESNRIEVAFLDVELFGESGVDLAEKLIAMHPRMNVVFLTGHAEYMAEAWRLHCSGYILKPLTPEKIRSEIAHLRFPVRGLAQ